MTKTDDLVLELRRAFAAYLNSFLPFEYENNTYRLVNNYVAAPWTRCDVCGNYPIKYVSVIRSSDGQRLRVGKNCIDQLTNRKVSESFSEFITKLENVTINRRYIDSLACILTACKSREHPCQISENDIERLNKAFELMCNGFNPTRQQEQLAEHYISMSDCTECKVSVGHAGTVSNSYTNP
jgi:hypothetical protein